MLLMHPSNAKTRRVLVCRYVSPAAYENTGREKRSSLERVSQAHSPCAVKAIDIWPMHICLSAHHLTAGGLHTCS